MQDQWHRLDQIQTPQLRNNLQALSVVDPELLQLLQQHINDETLLFQKQESFIRCRTSSDPPQWLFGENNPEQEQKKLTQQIHAINRKASLYVLMGNAAGYSYAVLQPLIRNNPEKRVLILEPNASRLWAMLALLDVSHEIIQSQIYLAYGKLNEKNVFDLIHKYNQLNHEIIDCVVAPESNNNLNIESIQNSYQQEKKLYVQKRTVQLKNLQQHETTNVINRVLLIDCWVGKPGSVHLRSINEALQKQNIQTLVLPINYQRINWHQEEYITINDKTFIDALDSFQPQIVLSFGYHAPEFIHRDVYESSNALWVQVVSNLAYQPKEYFPNEKPILVEEKLLRSFQKKGVETPIFLPLVANEIAKEPVLSSKNIPVVFIGNSFTMLQPDVNVFQQRIIGRKELQKYCQHAEDDLSNFDNGLNLFTYLENSTPPQIEHEDDEYHIFRYLLSQATARRRIQVLESIADTGLMLFGGDWDRALPSSSTLRSCFRQYADKNVKQQLNQQGFIFLNIHSVGNATCPNMRFFNTPGVGAFQISDQKQFSTFFEPDMENVFYSSISELKEKIDYFLAHPEQADDIRLAGYEKVKSFWTYDQWIKKAFSELGVEFPA